MTNHWSSFVWFRLRREPADCKDVESYWGTGLKANPKDNIASFWTCIVKINRTLMQMSSRSLSVATETRETSSVDETRLYRSRASCECVSVETLKSKRKVDTAVRNLEVSYKEYWPSSRCFEGFLSSKAINDKFIMSNPHFFSRSSKNTIVSRLTQICYIVLIMFPFSYFWMFSEHF